MPARLPGADHGVTIVSEELDATPGSTMGPLAGAGADGAYTAPDLAPLRWHATFPTFPTPPGCRRVRVPLWGWLDADDEIRARVDRFFHVPMLVLALLVLPLLGLEYLQAREIPPGEISPLHQTARSIIRHPVMQVTVAAAMVFIWLAFLIEFVVKISIAPSRVKYATKNWLDIVIIVLPMLRPLRGVRAMRAARLARMSRVFTLRGVAMKLGRTAIAMVIGLEYVRRLQSRFKKPPAPGAARTDYTRWSRSALVAEIERLNRRIRELEANKGPSTPPTDTGSAAAPPPSDKRLDDQGS